jgi:hypothetical protein
MTTRTDQISADLASDLPCHRCGYDLRAHPSDGICPECSASVAESIRVAAIPTRPAWRESDRRWRRRILLGTWVLVFLPLIDALKAFGWASRLPVPTIFDYRHTVHTLDETLLCYQGVFAPLMFCTGAVLLFSKERGRRRGRCDWTRRWGALCSYVVFLISAAGVLFISALVLAGIAAVCLNMPMKYQPGPTRLFLELSTRYLRYGPQPMTFAAVVLVVFSSVVILLACFPLFDALRSTGCPKRRGAILLAPLALFALMHIAQTVWYCFRPRSVDVFHYEVYFWPEFLATTIAGLPSGLNLSRMEINAFVVEAAKWCTVLGIAIWFSTAQFAAWRERKTSARQNSPINSPASS